MTTRINPFRPGGIAAPGMFAGRLEELIALEKALVQASNQNPPHFLVRGERGIGKSSLLFYLEAVATGTFPTLDDERLCFLVVSIALDKYTTFPDLIRRIGKGLEAGLARHQKAREVLKDAWELLKRVEAFGVKYAGSPASVTAQDEALDAIVATAVEVTSRLHEEIGGVLILIDESDKAPASADLGLFLKHLTERLARASCYRVLIGLAGLPGVVDKLKKSHESAPRIFNIMTLAPLTPTERVQVVRRGLEKAKETNGRAFTISEEAEAWIASLSEGYPHFIQQFAYSAFEADSDDHISIDDVMSGATEENGAFRQLGLKYFEELYFDQIGADEYRSVLRAMAEALDGWVTKDDLRKKTGLKAYTINNAVIAARGKSACGRQTGDVSEFCESDVGKFVSGL